MNTTHEDAVSDFDLDFLHPPNKPFPAAKHKFACSLKKRIVKANALYTNYHIIKQELNIKNKHIEETIKKLDSTNLEYKQTSLEYQKALESITKFETENQKLRVTTKKLGDEYLNTDNELRAVRSHLNQLQQLVKQHEKQIETFKNNERENIDKLSEEKLIAKNKSKDKEILSWKKKYDALQKQMEALQSGRKRKLSKNLLSSEKNYNDTNTSDSIFTEDPSFQDDDISEECAPLSARRSGSQTSLDTQRDSFHDYIHDIVSVDTGCGSSLCSSDNEKCLNSPDFVFSPINVGGIENQSRLKLVSTATSPIHPVRTVEAATSPIKSVRMVETATSPIPSLNIIEVATKPLRSVKTVEVGTSTIGPNIVDVGTSPIQIVKLVETVMSPVPSLGLIEAMTNPTQSENKPLVNASKIPSMPIIGPKSPIITQTEDNESDDDLMVFMPIRTDQEETLDKLPNMDIEEDTNGNDEMDMDDFEKEQEETSTEIETSVKNISILSAQVSEEEVLSNNAKTPEIASENLSDTSTQVPKLISEDLSNINAHTTQIPPKEPQTASDQMTEITSVSVDSVPFLNAESTQIAREDLPSTGEQAKQITSASVEDVSNNNAPVTQITSKEVPSISVMANEIIPPNIGDVHDSSAQATQITSACLLSIKKQTTQIITSCDDNIHDINLKETQVTLENVQGIPSINVQPTKASAGVEDLPSINIQTTQVASENAENVPVIQEHVTLTSSKCIEDNQIESEGIPTINVQIAQQKECLEINNSNNMVKDRNIDNEVEMIFDEMRLNYKLITPLPKTPIKSRCQINKTVDNEELANMKKMLSNIGNYLMESLSMPVAKLRENVNQLWFSKLFSNSSNLNGDNLTDPFLENVDEPLPQSNLVIPEPDTSVWSPDPNMTVISEEVLETNDQSKTKQDEKILLHKDIPKMNNDECSDQTVLNVEKNSVCLNDSVELEITSPMKKRKRRAKRTKKLTNLLKYRIKCAMPKYKIRSVTPPLVKENFKTKLIRHTQQNNASAILNNKEAYAKAAKVMAELNAKKTNQINIENNTSVKEPTEMPVVKSKKTDNSSIAKEVQSLNATSQHVPLDIDQEPATITRSMKSAQTFATSSEPAIATQRESITSAKAYVASPKDVDLSQASPKLSVLPPNTKELSPTPTQSVTVPSKSALVTRRLSITSPNVCVASPKDIILSRASPRLSIMSSNTAELPLTPPESAAVSSITAVVTRSRSITSPKACITSPLSPKSKVLSPSPRASLMSSNIAVLSPTPAASATVSSIPAVVTRSRSILSPKLSLPKSMITSPSLPESSETPPTPAVISPPSTKLRTSLNLGMNSRQHSITSPKPLTKLPLTPKTLLDVPPKTGVVSPKATKASQGFTVASPEPLITSSESAFEKPITRSSINNSVNMTSSITTRSRNRGVNPEIQNTDSSSSNHGIQEKDELQLTRKRTRSNNCDVPCKRKLLNDGTAERPTKEDNAPFHPKQSILCCMIEKYAVKTLRNGCKTAPDTILKSICNKIDTCVATIADIPLNKCTSAMEQLIDELKKYDYKVFVLGLMKFLTMKERKAELFGKQSNPPIPQMTKTEQVLLYIIKQIRNYWSVDLLDAVLSNIEYRLFKLTQTADFDIIESVSHFFAILCRGYDKMSRLLMFMLDAMYCTSFKSVPLIQQCLDVWPHVIPLAHMSAAKTPLFTCLVYLLYYFKCEDRHNRVQEIRNILERKYFYQLTEWNQSKMLDMLRNSIKDLRNIPIEIKMLRMTLIILGKRHGTQWTQDNLIKKVLQPFIDDEKLAEHKRAFCLSLLGALTKPYPNDMKVHCEIAMNQLINIIQTKPSKVIEEAAITSIILMARHNFQRVNEFLLSRKMCGMSSELEDLIRNHIRTKTRHTWITMLSKMSCAK